MRDAPSSPAVRAACEQVIGLIADYLNGELDADLHGRFERHLSQCAECLAYVNTCRETLRLARSLPPADMPSGIKQRLLELITPREP